MDFKKYFDQMIDWKNIPKYKLEPRIDSFIGYYLLGFLNKEYDENIIGIIPEFPLKKSDNNQSNNVDFLAISKSGKLYLVELKTDSNSIKDEQEVYLINAKDNNLEKLIVDLDKILTTTESKDKYYYLLEKLNNYKKIIDNSENVASDISTDIEVIYIIPSKTILEKQKNKLVSINPNFIKDFSNIIEYLKQLENKCLFEYEFIRALEVWEKNEKEKYIT